AVAAALAAAAAGVRSFTATGSQGLGYAHEIVAQAPSFRAPFLLGVANRTLGWYWSLQSDYSDMMPTRDLAWIIGVVETVQESFDFVPQLYKISENEKVLLPAMLSLDGFNLTHSTEKVLLPSQEEIDDFLPPRKNYRHTLDPYMQDTFLRHNVPQNAHTIYRRIFEETFERAKKVIYEVTKEYSEKFNRDSYGLIEEYKVDGSEALLVTMGSMTTAARRAVDSLRDEGKKVGLVKLRFYRPFPTKELVELAEKTGVSAFGVVDRMVSHGRYMGPVGLDAAAALYKLKNRPAFFNFIAGMGGEDISISDFKKMYGDLLGAKGSGEVDIKTVFVEKKPVIPTPQFVFKDRLIGAGSFLCTGCGITLLSKYIFNMIDKNTVIAVPPSCYSVGIPSVTGVPQIIANFAAPAAFARGYKRAYLAKGSKTRVMVIAGDGCAADIGLQSLSSAAEANEPILWVTYDNEAYMNTGIQRSGTTPFAAWTTTTPVGARWKGKREFSKNMIDIMVAHRIPYIATLSVAFTRDFETKFKKGMEVTDNNLGMAYLHIQQPCPTGWRFDTSKTVEVARLAVLTGMWPLIEVDNGVFKLTFKPAKLRPVADYVKLQGRFAHVTEEQIKSLQEFVEKNWKRLLELDGKRLW
ncbi:MAG: thiamine pyrophosphate-dependent enzyme, partial [Candidatus Methanomethylicaceae archaeon]